MTEAAATGPSEREKFIAFTKRIMSVPKSEIDRREAEYKKRRKAEKRGRKSGS